MDITIDLTPIFDFISQPAEDILWQIFYTVGWIPLAFTFLWGVFELWMEYINNQWAAQQKSVLLAIDIPKANAQSPKAVENIFSYLAGAHGSINLIETYWDGKFQRSFSFEIVSIDGYTQFLIRSPLEFRHLLESAVYSQYPDAEITEVNDYTAGMPTKFPDDEWDVWGVEFIQAKPTAYPIKTYEDFEHKFGEPEFHFKDPMAPLMDLCASLRKGEQLWFQIILRPEAPDFLEKAGEKEIKTILKEEVKQEKNIADKVSDSILGAIGDFSEFIYKLWGDISEKKEEKKDDALKMMNLKPKEKKQVEAISDKIAKMGYSTKLRFVYMAKKDVMVKPKVVNGFVGYMKQFASIDLNNFKPDMKMTATSAHYFFKDYRLNAKKNAIVNNYINRDGSAGKNMGALNIEELATLWHFPVESVVKAPMIGKAAGRKAEPPSNIPIGEETVAEEIMMPVFEQEVLGRPSSQDEERPAGQPGQLESVFAAEAIPGFMAQDDPNKKADDIKKEKGAPPENLPFV